MSQISDSTLNKYDELVNVLYGAAVDEITWEHAVDRIFGVFRAKTGGFCFQDKYSLVHKDVLVRGFEAGALDEYDEYFGSINPWFKTPGLIKHNVIMNEAILDVAHKKRGVFHSSEYYHDWLKPYDLHSAIGFSLPTRGSNLFSFGMMRQKEYDLFNEEEIYLLTKIMPHIRRAVEATDIIRSAQIQDKQLMTGLDKLGIGMVVLNYQGKVVKVNRTTEGISNGSDGLELKEKSLIAKHIRANKLLSNIESLLSTTNNAGSLEWINVPRISKKSPYQLLYIRPSQATSLFNVEKANTIILIIDPVKNNKIHPKNLQESLNLTPREADILLLSMKGYRAKKISLEIGITYESVRWYIKQVCQKMGANSQTEMVAKAYSHMSLSSLESDVLLTMKE